MIELKDVSKIYHSKKGKNTKALDHVSIKFEDKGMTFILGKSGSGKSTLLNIIGGLDQYDSGNMVILGKSSQHFNQAALDSYRNTYIGFVFQEFNILEDYDVYENISLALQLQQKKIEKEKIEQLLEKLELTELKHRKVNELSGGQKQRVAIARALIKDPKIILADEPTGNLDSKTSIQVMELLKEISKQKLVIIVSHDKESADIYGDRIIEIEDGRIKNDTKKQENIENLDNPYQTISSKLPLKESLKLGIGSLKHKKIKLFFTILLTMCTLLFLSIIDTLSNYDIEKAHSKLLAEKEEQFVQIEKYEFYHFDPYDFTNKDQLPLQVEDKKIIQSKITNKIYPIYHLKEEFSSSSMADLLKIKVVSDDIPYVNLYDTADIVAIDSISSILKEELIGKFPSNPNEIVISNYIADIIIKNGIMTYEASDNEFMIENWYQPKDYHDLLNSNHTFYFGSKGQVKIVGIIAYDLSLYEDIKEKKYENFTKENHNQYSDLIYNIRNIYNKIYVNNSFVDHLKVKKIVALDSTLYNYHLKSNHIEFEQEGYYVAPAILDEEIEYYDGTNWKKTSYLSSNEILLDIRQLKNFSYDTYQKNLLAYLEKYPDERKEILEKKFFENYVKNEDVIGKTISLEIFKGRSYNPNKPDDQYQDLKIIGLVGFQNDNQHYNYFSNDLVGKYKVKEIQTVGYLVPLTQQKDFKKVLSIFPYNETLSTKTTYSNEVNDLIRTILILRKIAFWVSLILLIFTIFLIGNFIITSIHYRKREIGVLRALGARSRDIMKIFFWEGLFMSFLAGTIASILLVVVTNLLNTMIMAGTQLILTPFLLEIRQFIVIYGLVFMVTMIASVLPIMKISKMKPIDAILNK